MKRSKLYLILAILLLMLLLIFLVSKTAAAEAVPDSTLIFRKSLNEYFKNLPGSKERTELLAQLKSLNQPFAEWLDIYNRNDSSSELRAMILDKLAESCSTPEECAELWPLLPTKGDYLNKVFNKWLNLTQTVNELLALYEKVRFSVVSNYEEKVRHDIMENDLSLAELIPVITYSNKNPDLAGDLYRKLKKIKAPYEEWAPICALVKRESIIYDLVVEKMFDQAKTFKHGYELYQMAQGDEKLEKKSLKIILSKAETFKQKLVVFQIVDSDSKEQKKLFEELLEVAKTRKELNVLEILCPPGSEMEKKVKEKIKKLDKNKFPTDKAGEFKFIKIKAP